MISHPHRHVLLMCANSCGNGATGGGNLVIWVPSCSVTITERLAQGLSGSGQSVPIDSSVKGSQSSGLSKPSRIRNSQMTKRLRVISCAKYARYSTMSIEAYPYSVFASTLFGMAITQWFLVLHINLIADNTALMSCIHSVSRARLISCITIHRLWADTKFLVLGCATTSPTRGLFVLIPIQCKS